jgi:hypothetical protein
LLRCFADKTPKEEIDGDQEQDHTRAKTGPGACGRGQNHEVRYEAKKTSRSAAAVKKAVKKVGNSRKQVEKRVGR